MGIFSKLFGKKDKEEKVGGMEDYMSLIRVYFQAALAEKLGITNLAMLPELRVFKTTMHVPTQNNKLGVGEKAFVKKMMRNVYQTEDDFFKEIDQSIRKNCHKLQDVNTYLIQFQGFTQELMMLMGNLMKFKLRLPSIFKKNDFKDAGVMNSILAVRQYDKKLGFSQKWISDFVYQVVMLAKNEPKPSDEDVEKAKAKMK